MADRLRDIIGYDGARPRMRFELDWLKQQLETRRGAWIMAFVVCGFFWLVVALCFHIHLQ